MFAVEALGATTALLAVETWFNTHNNHANGVDQLEATVARTFGEMHPGDRPLNSFINASAHAALVSPR